MLYQHDLWVKELGAVVQSYGQSAMPMQSIPNENLEIQAVNPAPLAGLLPVCCHASLLGESSTACTAALGQDGRKACNVVSQILPCAPFSTADFYLCPLIVTNSGWEYNSFAKFSEFL